MKTRKELGGKAYNLKIIGDSGNHLVPAFLVLESDCLNELLKESLDELMPSVPCGEAKDAETLCPDTLCIDDLDREAMLIFLGSLENDSQFVEKLQTYVLKKLELEGVCAEEFAVRSSALDEDGEFRSYAGQLESYLRVKPEELAVHVIRVWSSNYKDQVTEYRKMHGLDTMQDLPAVIVQVMINADRAGVAFGADILSGSQDKITINSVSGTAENLVNGTVNGSQYELIRGKVTSYEEDDGALTVWQIKQIEKAVMSLENLFSHPQDVEWAFENNRLYIVQSRNITTLPGDMANANVDIFDNSNIGESYPGVTTPLTFSFARQAYENVYKQFALLMGVRPEVIEANRQIFPRMLGLIDGRIYYNLINWYRLLKLFPGYEVNQSFMEEMMGLKDGIADKLPPDERHKKADSPIKSAWSLIVSLQGLLIAFVTLNHSTEAFQSRLNKSLTRVKEEELRGKKVDNARLVALYRELEKDLLTKWDAPIVNDFFAMIFYGLLKKLSKSWLSEPGIHNKLLCGESGIVSTEPTRMLKEMNALVERDHVLKGILERFTDKTDRATLEQRLRSFPQFKNLYLQYLDRFGSRSAGELKLESTTLNDNPGLLAGSLLAMGNRAGAGNVSPQTERAAAEKHMTDCLVKDPLKLIVFKAILHQARARIKARENLRFERTRLFAAVREIFRALGRNLASDNRLEHAEDVFYLEIEELLRFVEGTATMTNLAALAKIRREEFAKYQDMPSPPDRVEVTGGLHTGTRSTAGARKDHAYNQAASWRGRGCCPGIVEGEIKVMQDPNKETMEGYKILVAERTDPGWITAISSADGIVVEYGSLLSHTAIVARELGIPTIVAAAGVTKSLKTGDRVRLDGASGQVDLLTVREDLAA